MPRHPGLILASDFLLPLGISPNKLAIGLGVNRSTISRLLAGRQPITPTMAARLGAFFNVPARWWLLMQAEYDAAVMADVPELTAQVKPLEPNPDVLLTPKGVLRLGPPTTSSAAEPLTLSQDELKSLPEMTSNPPPRKVREVRYGSGSVALVGDEL